TVRRERLMTLVSLCNESIKPAPEPARCAGSARQPKTIVQGRQATLAHDRRRYAHIPLTSWPRISPPGGAAVWTLTYQRPASRSAACASVRLAEFSNGLVLGVIGTATPAFLPGSAGPWKWAIVAGPDSPE